VCNGVGGGGAVGDPSKKSIATKHPADYFCQTLGQKVLEVRRKGDFVNRVKILESEGREPLGGE